MRVSRTTWIVAIAAAGVLALGAGITVGAVDAARADAAETAKACKTAREIGATVAKTAQLRMENADRSLTAVKSVDLPGGEGWKSVSYLSQAGTSGTAGNRLTAAVTAARDSVAATRIPTSCTTREQATRITRQAAKADSAGIAMDERIYQLMSDFGAFQAREHTRVAAEVEAARKAAEAAAAAKKAAEEEAARKAAAAEAARKAAAGSSGSGSASPAPSKPSGGGSVGGQLGGPVGSGGGVCQTSNGIGGTTRC